MALAESAIAGGIGVSAGCDDAFGEGDGRAVVTALPEHVEQLAALAGPLSLQPIGEVGGDAIVLSGQPLALDEAAEIYGSALQRSVEPA